MDMVCPALRPEVPVLPPMPIPTSTPRRRLQLYAPTQTLRESLTLPKAPIASYPTLIGAYIYVGRYETLF